LNIFNAKKSVVIQVNRISLGS